MLVKIFGSAVFGVDASTITIEVSVDGSGTKYFMVGLVPRAWQYILKHVRKNGRIKKI